MRSAAAKPSRALGLLLPLCLALILPAAASAQSAGLASVPAADSALAPGDRVYYTFTASPEFTKDGWLALRVRLGAGLQVQGDTVEFTPAPDQATASSAAMAEWELVSGNDGFVLLLSRLSAGDAVRFCAAVQEEGTLSVDVTAGASAAGLAHARRPAPAVPATATSFSLPADAGTVPPVPAQGVRWALVALCAACAGAAGVLAYRRIRFRIRAGSAPAVQEAPQAQEAQQVQQTQQEDMPPENGPGAPPEPLVPPAPGDTPAVP